MRAWLPLSRLGVLVLSLMRTCLFMHMCLASVDHHFIISGTSLELGSILLKNQQKLLFMHLSHQNWITVMHYIHGLPKYQLQRLQYVQNTGARVVLQVSKFQHITPVLCELHWLPIQYRIIFKILLLVYKSLNGTSPSYLAQELYYRSHTRSLRSVSNELLMKPRSYTKTYGDRAFAVHAPREWNLIPYGIRKSNTISSFKRSLKTYLFAKFSNNGSLFL